MNFVAWNGRLGRLWRRLDAQLERDGEAPTATPEELAEAMPMAP